LSSILSNGGVLTLLVLVPNALVLLLPPKDPPVVRSKNKTEGVMTIVERLGQASSLAIPFFYAIDLSKTRHFGPVLAGLALTLTIYYIGWVRYVMRREYSCFYKPLFHVPLPMAIMPVVYFVLSSYLLCSIYLFGSAVVLGIGHLSISNIELKKMHGEVRG
jgi:hypothetical protein